MHVIALTGGKGGIGKTTISINLAVMLAKTKRVLLFDADLGLANVDVLLGLQAKKTLKNFIEQQCSIEDLFLQGPNQLKIIPGDSGTQLMSELSSSESTKMIQAFSSITETFDYMLVDLASGISSQVINFTQAAQTIMLIICNDPASLMDSYAVIKLLFKKYGRSKFGIIVNKVKNQGEAYHIYNSFQNVVSQFIDISLNYYGFIPHDDYISLATRAQMAVVEKYPLSPATQAFAELTLAIHALEKQHDITGGIQYFMEKMLFNPQATDDVLCKV